MFYWMKCLLPTFMSSWVILELAMEADFLWLPLTWVLLVIEVFIEVAPWVALPFGYAFCALGREFWYLTELIRW